MNSEHTLIKKTENLNPKLKKNEILGKCSLNLKNKELCSNFLFGVYERSKYFQKTYFLKIFSCKKRNDEQSKAIY